MGPKIWGNHMMQQMYGSFEGFPLQKCLFWPGVIWRTTVFGWFEDFFVPEQKTAPSRVAQIFWLTTKGVGYLWKPQCINTCSVTPPEEVPFPIGNQSSNRHFLLAMLNFGGNSWLIKDDFFLRLMPVAKESFHAWQNIASAMYDKDTS